jgi:hypothetical protein
MSNFYIDCETPLKKIRTQTHPRELLLTQPHLPDYPAVRPSPLSVITKLVLGELQKPSLVRRDTSKRIQEGTVEIEKTRFVRRELQKRLDQSMNQHH